MGQPRVPQECHAQLPDGQDAGRSAEARAGGGDGALPDPRGTGAGGESRGADGGVDGGGVVVLGEHGESGSQSHVTIPSTRHADFYSCMPAPVFPYISVGVGAWRINESLNSKE